MSQSVLDKLHFLIHSLSKTEKRYVSLELSKQKSYKSKMDLLLFETLKKQKKLNEIAISKIKPFHKRKELIIRKNYLFDFILRCLIDYNYSRDIEIAIGNNIRIIKNLILKGLHDYAGYYIERAQHLAEKCEDLYRMGTILSLRKIIVNRSSESYTDFVEEIQKIEREENVLYEKIINLNQYNIANNQLTMILKKNSGSQANPDTLKGFNELASYSQFTDENKALTKKAKIIFHHVNASYASHVKRDVRRAFSHTEKQLEYIRELETYRKSNSTAFIAALKYYCIFSAETKQFEKAIDVLKTLRNLYEDKSISQNNFERYFIFQNYMEAETHLTFIDRKFERFSSILPKVEEGLQAFQSMFDSESKIVLYYTIATRLMFIREYKKSFRWLEKIFSESHGMREDILHSAHIASLICIYEFDDLSLFESRTRSYMRYYNLHPEKSEHYLKMIHYLVQIFRNKSDRHFLNELLNDFNDYLSAIHWQGQVENIFFDLLKTWIQSKSVRKKQSLQYK